MFAALLAACGDDESVPRHDPTSYESVFRETLAALADPDVARIDALLTAEAKSDLRHDLGRLQQSLRDEAQRAELLAAIRDRGLAIDPALIDAATRGGLPAVWRFFVAVSPAPAGPGTARLVIDPKRDDVVQAFYRDGNGTERPVVLRRVGSRWRVQSLQLSG